MQYIYLSNSYLILKDGKDSFNLSPSSAETCQMQSENGGYIFGYLGDEISTNVAFDITAAL